MSLSRITVSGTIKSTPEKRYTPSNIPVTNFLIEITYIPRGAVQDGETRIASHTAKINAWRDLAEYSEQAFKPGDKIVVTGKLQINAYTTNDGKKKREVEIDASSITMLDKLLEIELPKSKFTEAEQGSQNTNTRKSVEKTQKTTDDEFSDLSEAISNTEEVPF